MRSFKLLIISLLLTIAYNGFAQKSEKRSAAETKAADERKRSLDGHRNPQDLKETPDRNAQEEKREAEPLPEKSLVVTPNKDQPKNKIQNAPVVLQTITSESGSPAILSENNGRGRDGTGNVQRSSYNIAGAKIPADMNLSNNTPAQKNVNSGASRVRKQAEQPPRIISRKDQTVEPKAASREQADKGKAKEKSRKSRKGKARNSGK